MYEIMLDATGQYLKVTSAGTMLLEVGTQKQVRGLPSDLSYLASCGRDWVQVVLAKEVTAFRFSNEPDNGRWYTPYPFEGASTEEVQRWLELNSSNTASAKMKKVFPRGSTVLVSLMTSSEVVQIYDPSPWRLN